MRTPPFVNALAHALGGGTRGCLGATRALQRQEGDSGRAKGLATPKHWGHVENFTGHANAASRSGIAVAVPPAPALPPRKHAAVLGARTDGAAADYLRRQRCECSADVAGAESAVRREGFVIGEMALTTLMAMYVAVRDFPRSKETYQELRRKVRVTSRKTFHTLLNMKATEGDVAGAKQVWADLSRDVAPDAHAYTIVMQMHRRLGRRENAVKAYRAMVAAGVTPTAKTVTVFLSCCECPREARAEAETIDTPWDEALVTALVNVHARAGDLKGAYTTIYEAVDVKKAAKWTAYLSTFFHGDFTYRELAAAVEHALTHVPVGAGDVMFYGAGIKACQATATRLTKEREVRSCVVLAGKLMLRARRASRHWPRGALANSSKLWHSYLTVYETAGDTAGAQRVAQEMRDERVQVDRRLQEALDRIQHAAEADAAAREEPRAGAPPRVPSPSSPRKEYIKY